MPTLQQVFNSSPSAPPPPLPGGMTPQQFTSILGTGVQNTPANLPTPTTSVGPGGNVPFQSSLPSVPQPAAQPNVPGNIPLASANSQQSQTPVTLTAAQFKAKYGDIPPDPNGATGPTTLTAAQFKAKYGDLSPDSTGASGPTGATGSSGGISSGLASFAKDIFGAPATLLARPVQAAAELLGATSGQVDSATSGIENAVAGGLQHIPLVGNALADTTRGLVAPVDQNFGDVEKDAGRAAQTVALGIDGAPIAAGALFGGGASLAQGNPLFSGTTLADTALGAAGGKILDSLGRPILSAVGGVAGKFVPKDAQAAAAGIGKAVSDFAANHDLPFGLQNIATPAANAVQGAASAVDNTINKGTSNLFNGAKNAVISQYPGLDRTDSVLSTNKDLLMKPTTINESPYYKATNIANSASAQGIDLGDVANREGVFSHNIEGSNGRFNSKSTADGLKTGVMNDKRDVFTPAVEAAQHLSGTPNVPISDVRQAAIASINKIPSSVISDSVRQKMVDNVTEKYGEGSAADLAHPDGYSLTDLDTARVQQGTDGKYKVGQPASDITAARQARAEESAFRNLFDSNTPAEYQSLLQGMRRDFQERLNLSDYLTSIHGTKVPQSAVQKAIGLFGRGVGGLLGHSAAGFPGFIAGSRVGEMLTDHISTMPSPIRTSILNNLQASKSPVYTDLEQKLGTDVMNALKNPQLPPAGASSYIEAAVKQNPTLFSTPGGQAAPDLQTAVDMAGSRVAKAPTTNTKSPAYKAKVLSAQLNQGPYTPPQKLPVIDMGSGAKAPKRLNDIY